MTGFEQALCATESERRQQALGVLLQDPELARVIWAEVSRQPRERLASLPRFPREVGAVAWPVVEWAALEWSAPLPLTAVERAGLQLLEAHYGAKGLPARAWASLELDWMAPELDWEFYGNQLTALKTLDGPAKARAALLSSRWPPGWWALLRKLYLGGSFGNVSFAAAAWRAGGLRAPVLWRELVTMLLRDAVDFSGLPASVRAWAFSAQSGAWPSRVLYGEQGALHSRATCQTVLFYVGEMQPTDPSLAWRVWRFESWTLKAGAQCQLQGLLVVPDFGEVGYEPLDGAEGIAAARKDLNRVRSFLTEHPQVQSASHPFALLPGSEQCDSNRWAIVPTPSLSRSHLALAQSLASSPDCLLDINARQLLRAFAGRSVTQPADGVLQQEDGLQAGLVDPRSWFEAQPQGDGRVEPFSRSLLSDE